MGKAYKCDLCGKFYTISINDKENKRITNIAITQYIKGSITYNVDLCADCAEALSEWMGRKINDSK